MHNSVQCHHSKIMRSCSTIRDPNIIHHTEIIKETKEDSEKEVMGEEDLEVEEEQ